MSSKVAFPFFSICLPSHLLHLIQSINYQFKVYTVLQVNRFLKLNYKHPSTSNYKNSELIHKQFLNYGAELFSSSYLSGI